MEDLITWCTREEGGEEDARTEDNNRTEDRDHSRARGGHSRSSGSKEFKRTGGEDRVELQD